MASRISFRPEQVDPTVFIASGAVVQGDVTIGSESSVWFGAVIRGDTEAIVIGSRTNIQDLCVLHADPGFPCRLADDVTVGHAAIVHGAQIGPGAMIGMRAVVMNGAKIGAGSIVGVGAVVTEETEIPPGSVVMGIPGKVVRQVRPEDAQRLSFAAAHYVARAREYRAG